MMQAKRSALRKFLQARRLAGMERSRTKANTAPPPVSRRLGRLEGGALRRSRLALADEVSDTELWPSEQETPVGDPTTAQLRFTVPL